MLKHFCLFLYGLFFSVSGLCQEYTSKDKRAIKSFEEAQKQYQVMKYQEAIKEAENALSRDPKFIEPYALLAQIYEETDQIPKAIESLKKAIEVDPGIFKNNFLWIADLELKEGKYQDAKSHLEYFLASKTLSPISKERANRLMRTANFAIDKVKNPVPFNPVNMGENINTKDYEYYPTITADDQTFLFTRSQRVGDRGISQEDFYVSKKVDGKWQKAENVGPPLNSEVNEGAPSISADGQLLFFAGCMNENGYGANRNGLGSCDIFYTRKRGDNWVRPQNVGLSVNSTHWESQPSFSSDGKTLYFIRGNRGRGQSTEYQDIYTSYLQENGEWSKAAPLSNKINTAGTEESVFIHPDNQTLYFSSDGHPGMGGLDLFMSKRQPNGEWGEPVNLGYPINTSKNENSLLVSGDGKLAYFASDREGGLGGLDLYQFELPEQDRPEMLTYFKGRVLDKETQKPLEARFELIDVATGKPVVESYSNPGTGEFLVSLPANKDYALNVSRPDYLFYSENFSLKEKRDKNEPYLMNVLLSPIKVGEKVVLKNIFFATGSFELKEESIAELDKLNQFLSKNPQIKIELSGHTDNVGDKKSNQLLSENRAKAVYDFLVKKGIPAERLTYKGFGDTQPIVPNTSDENRAVNRRTEFKIL